MPSETLAGALEREHREIDQGIEAFLVRCAEGRLDAGPLTRAVAALRRHIFLEEELLFPPLRDAGMAAPILVMLREHGEIWEMLDVLEAQLETGVAGAAVSETCEQLLAQLDRHNSKEEPIVYPQADGVLNEAASLRLSTFLAAGRMPKGWRCARTSQADPGVG